MGGDSCSEDCEFKSQHRILDGYFSHFFCYNNYNVCLNKKRDTIKKA